MKNRITCLESAMEANKQVLLVAQKEACDTDEPSIEDLFNVGTVATILQLLKLPDGTVKKYLLKVNSVQKIHQFKESEFFRGCRIRCNLRT
ncbi:LON peptidase substrate-binding domain-containing protein [Vibrio lentus]|nr:LON peptidase substrate-binding domain-containing protein [Vibrio lentus]